MTSRTKLRALAALAIALGGRSVGAQTDYYNTDAGRPIRVEDAYPVERRAFELQLAPLRLERAPGGRYAWGVEPEAAYGILPRTHIEVGFPLAFIENVGAAATSGLAGIELSMLHNLNVETRLPALGVVADVLIPAGGLGPDKAYPSVKAIATKTFSWMRFHVNGQYTFGDAPAAGTAGVHVSRWMAGVAADRTLPLRSLLFTGEIVAEQPLEDEEDLEWSTGAGIRYQLTPRWALDAGIGTRLDADVRPWFVTFGSAYAFGLPWYPRR